MIHKCRQARALLSSFAFFSSDDISLSMPSPLAEYWALFYSMDASSFYDHVHESGELLMMFLSICGNFQF